jgi:hypothetical protein
MAAPAPCAQPCAAPAPRKSCCFLGGFCCFGKGKGGYGGGYGGGYMAAPAPGCGQTVIPPQGGFVYPPGTYPPGTYPPGTYPPGTVVPGTVVPVDPKSMPKVDPKLGPAPKVG